MADDKMQTQGTAGAREPADSSGENFQRLGRVQRIERDRLELAGGTVPFDAGRLVNKLTLVATDPLSKETDYKKCAVKVTRA